MRLHRRSRLRRVPRLDSSENGFVFSDRARDTPLLGQRQPAITVDMNLDLLNQCLDSGMTRDFGDRRMEQFVSLMERIVVGSCVRLALALDDRMQRHHLT